MTSFDWDSLFHVHVRFKSLLGVIENALYAYACKNADVFVHMGSPNVCIAISIFVVSYTHTHTYIWNPSFNLPRCRAIEIQSGSNDPNLVLATLGTRIWEWRGQVIRKQGDANYITQHTWFTPFPANCKFLMMIAFIQVQSTNVPGLKSVVVKLKNDTGQCSALEVRERCGLSL